MDNIEISVLPSEEGERLDKFLSFKIEGLTRSFIQNLIKDGYVKINGDIILSKNHCIASGDEIIVSSREPQKLEIMAENIPIEVVYEDEDLLIVNKPKGMVVHPAAGNYNHTLVNALLYHCGDSLSGINGVIRPGIVHRIDKDTSGLLMVAKNDFSHQKLASQIRDHSFKREYEAVVYGGFKNSQGVINAPIGRHQQKRKQMAVTDKASKHAITHYRVINSYKDFTHLRLKLETGRTHQIRVHMAYINHPLAGDVFYGPKKVIKQLNGQCLHAKFIGLIHPRSGEYMEFETQLPKYFSDFLADLQEKG